MVIRDHVNPLTYSIVWETWYVDPIDYYFLLYLIIYYFMYSNTY